MEGNEKKFSFSKIVKDEDLFYGCVRWLILLVGLATLIVLVFMPAISYLKGEHEISRLISMIINAMGVASLLLAIHSLTESRSSSKELHEVTNKLEKFSGEQEKDVKDTIEAVRTVASQLEKLASRQETNTRQTMEKLEELGKTQKNIHTMLKNSTTATRERKSLDLQLGEFAAVWKKEDAFEPGMADPEDSLVLPEVAEPAKQK